MGRAPIHDKDADPQRPVKLTLREVRLDNGGYDTNGTYFGWTRDSTVYWYADEAGTIDATLRATSRKLAKAEIRETYPKARFYN